VIAHQGATVAKKSHSLCFFYHSCQPAVLKIFHSPLLPISVKEISSGSSGHSDVPYSGKDSMARLMLEDAA